MRPTGKDRKIMKRDLGGLYAVGVFRLNKVGGFILGSYGDKKHFDVEYRVEKSQFSISSELCSSGLLMFLHLPRFLFSQQQ